MQGQLSGGATGAMRGLSIYLNGDRGIACVRAISKAGHKIDDLVVPESQEGRFQALADEMGADLRAPRDINHPDNITHMRDKKAAIGIIAGFSAIFSRALIESHSEGVLNLHAGRLPNYRGGSPLNWQIINGEREAGLSILYVTEGIDDGPVLASTNIPIMTNDDIASVHQKANAAFPELICAVLEKRAKAGKLPPGTHQNRGAARYWLQRSDVDGKICWDRMKATDVHNFVRALTRPYPGAWAGDVRIWQTSVECPVVCGPPGRVAYIRGVGPLVCCSDRAILVTEATGARLRHGMYL